jgi:hypothetical protein
LVLVKPELLPRLVAIDAQWKVDAGDGHLDAPLASELGCHPGGDVRLGAPEQLGGESRIADDGEGVVADARVHGAALGPVHRASEPLGISHEWSALPRSLPRVSFARKCKVCRTSRQSPFRRILAAVRSTASIPY